MFHDLGLNEQFRGSGHRFEVDSADEARRFLQGHGVPEDSIRRVWTAIALHTTPGVPEFMEPEVAWSPPGSSTTCSASATTTSPTPTGPRSSRCTRARTSSATSCRRSPTASRPSRRPRSATSRRTSWSVRPRLPARQLRGHHRELGLAGIGRRALRSFRFGGCGAAGDPLPGINRRAAMARAAGRGDAVADNRGMPSPSGQPASAADLPAPRVVLADDDVLLREGLASLLDRSGFEVVGQAGDGPGCSRLVRSARPELAIIDIRMPPGTRPRGCRRPGRSARNCPARRSSCCPRTSRWTRRWICWPAGSGWATC